MSQHQLQLGPIPGLWPPTWPMGLTMLRLLLLPVFLYVLLIDVNGQSPAHPHRWLAIGIFAVMAITDKLDGYLARRLHQTSKLGTILDPAADKLLVACSVILLSFAWIAPPPYQIPIPVVIAVYGKDVIIVCGTIALLALVGKVSVSPRPLGKLSTFLQLTLVMATLLAPDLRRGGQALPAVLLRGLWWAVSILALASCTDYVWQGLRQYRAAQKPVPATDSSRECRG